MDLAYSMGMWALILIIVASVIYGGGRPDGRFQASFDYEWRLTAIAAGIGAFGASEFIVGLRDWEPVFDGLALVPALIGGRAGRRRSRRGRPLHREWPSRRATGNLMSELPSAAQGSRARAAVEEAAARPPVPLRRCHSTLPTPKSCSSRWAFCSFQGHRLTGTGLPARRCKAHANFVAFRPRANSDVRANTAKGSSQVVLEWPRCNHRTRNTPGARSTSLTASAKKNRFASFGGVVSVARDRDVHAALFRSNAPILSAGRPFRPRRSFGRKRPLLPSLESSGPPAGSDRYIGDLIRGSSPVTLYAAFLARSLAVHRAARLGNPSNSRYEALLRQELCRLERETGAELLSGEQLRRSNDAALGCCAEEVSDG